MSFLVVPYRACKIWMPGVVLGKEVVVLLGALGVDGVGCVGGVGGVGGVVGDGGGDVAVNPTPM